LTPFLIKKKKLDLVTDYLFIHLFFYAKSAQKNQKKKIKKKSQ